jgi:hypothetical protein
MRFAPVLVAFTLLLSSPAPSRAQQALDRTSTEREVMAVLDAFIAAFNQNDARAEENTYHFPHYRLAGGQMTRLDAPGVQTHAWMNGAYKTLRATGWHHSRWTRRKVVHLSTSKAHVDTEFTRYRQDGSVISANESLYVLTKVGDRWGITLRSSFAP